LEQTAGAGSECSGSRRVEYRHQYDGEYEEPDQAEAHDDARQGDSGATLGTAGVPDLTSCHKTEDDAENARQAEQEGDDAGTRAGQ
jgi:hypothetical protein